MTSTSRHLKFSQPKWDYSVQEYKPFRDVFSEKGLFSILFLACGRPEITRRCLLSTIDAVSNFQNQVEWILMENGNNEENYEFFRDLALPRKVIVRQDNYGINEGLNQMWALSRGEYCLILENDWENRVSSFDFLSVAKDIFENNGDIAIIQLRAVNDPCENFGYRKPMYNPWSCNEQQLDKAGLRLFSEETKNKYKYYLGTGFYGFNNNPSIILKKLYRECGPYPEAQIGSDPRHGETLFQEEVIKTQCAVAHISKELYYHIGNIQTKENLCN